MLAEINPTALYIAPSTAQSSRFAESYTPTADMPVMLSSLPVPVNETKALALEDTLGRTLEEHTLEEHTLEDALESEARSVATRLTLRNVTGMLGEFGARFEGVVDDRLLLPSFSTARMVKTAYEVRGPAAC